MGVQHRVAADLLEAGQAHGGVAAVQAAGAAFELYDRWLAFSGLGLLLGFHLAANITQMVDRMWGFRVALELPWGYVITSILLTISLCLVAGIIPARHAARTNIVDALHVT